MINDEPQALLAQAKSDLEVFHLLVGFDRTRVPACHPLHYLQMATEKLAKAVHRRLDIRPADRLSHMAFSQIPHHLRRRDVALALGWDQFSQFRGFLRNIHGLCRSIETLSPAVGSAGSSLDAPNVEYPWRVWQQQRFAGWRVPAHETFSTLELVEKTVFGVQFYRFLHRLIDRFDQLPVADGA